MEIERLLADVARKLDFSRSPWGNDPEGVFARFYDDIATLRKSLFDLSNNLSRERREWVRTNARKRGLLIEFLDGPCPKCGGDYFWSAVELHETVRVGRTVERFKEKNIWDEILYCATCEPPADPDLVDWEEDRKPSSDGNAERDPGKISPPTSQAPTLTADGRTCEMCGASLAGRKASATCCSGRCRIRKAVALRRKRQVLAVVPDAPNGVVGGYQEEKT